MEAIEMLTNGVLSPQQAYSRRVDIEQGLVENGIVYPRLLRQPTMVVLIDSWFKYVTLQKEDSSKYMALKQRLIQEFGAQNVEWLISNTYLLHQVQYLRKKGLPTSGVEQRNVAKV